MKEILKKIFLFKHCINFSKISGDKNSLHLDKKINRYSQFQKPIVPGILVLQYLFKSNFIKNLLKDIITIFVVFKSPIFINEEIRFNIKKKK